MGAVNTQLPALPEARTQSRPAPKVTRWRGAGVHACPGHDIHAAALRVWRMQPQTCRGKKTPPGNPGRQRIDVEVVLSAPE